MPGVKGKRVVVFGDSLSADPSSPGGVFAARLRASGADVMVDARVGRSAINFYDREDVGAHLAAIRAFAPQLVIVELGTNDLGRDPARDLDAFARLRVDLGQGGAPVWAFGPPTFPSVGKGSENGPAVPAVWGTMKAVFGDKLLDLRPLTRDRVPAGTNGRTGDGVHFTAAGGKIVGERMADVFLSAGSGGVLIALAVLAAAAILLR